MRKNNFKKAAVGAGILLGVCVLGFSVTVNAQGTGRRDKIQSEGNLNFESGKVYIASDDFRYLADEIDGLEKTYKVTLVNALNRIGTYFKNDGTAVRDASINEVDTEAEKVSLTFSKIVGGIEGSQYVEEDKAAASEHLSAGKAAWVNGSLVIGNGVDCEKARKEGQESGYQEGHADGFKEGYQEGHAVGNQEGYEAGYQEGYENGYADGEAHASEYWEEGYREGYSKGAAEALSKVQVTYTYHEHSGDSDGSGCYSKEVYHVHSGNSKTGGGCYSRPNRHTHEDSCKLVEWCPGWVEGSFSHEDGMGSWYNYYCYDCGWEGIGTNGAHPRSLIICGMEQNQILSYNTGCGKNEKTLEGYALGCGKTEQTIESATIIY